VSQRREVSSIVALVAPLTGPAGLYARHFEGSIHGEQVIEALRYFRRRIGRPLLVIWDGLHAHRATTVQRFLVAQPEDYQIEPLPAYAPELNPEELCNGAVKQDLRNALPGSVDELRRQVRSSFVRLGRQHDRLLSFFHHTRLPVT
jgi:transposase